MDSLRPLSGRKQVVKRENTLSGLQMPQDELALHKIA